MNNVTTIAEWKNVDIDIFNEEVVPLNKPAVLKALVSDWPAVKAGLSSNRSIIDYLKSFDNGTPVYTIVGDPDISGRFFYRDDLQGVNFQRVQAKFTAVIEQIYGLQDKKSPHAIAIQAASIRDTLPGFDTSNKLPLLSESVTPTMWLGNRAVVAPHYDVHDNIAVVAAGKRTFTLFPPEQVANLYVGPALEAPGGVPISMVDVRDPDLQRFPRFSVAMSAAQTATLEPGDAIYIPSPWWHAVESLESFNMLVNYWWGGNQVNHISPNNSLMHSMLSIANLSDDQRKSWRHFFDYYVFKHSGDPSDHLPKGLNDILTSMTEQQQQAVLDFLREKLQ